MFIICVCEFRYYPFSFDESIFAGEIFPNSFECSEIICIEFLKKILRMDGVFNIFKAIR